MIIDYKIKKEGRIIEDYVNNTCAEFYGNFTYYSLTSPNRRTLNGFRVGFNGSNLDSIFYWTSPTTVKKIFNYGLRV